jgi:hypothetical protein
VGILSFAAGMNTIANGEVSTALGRNTTANGYSSTVIGLFNEPIVSAQTDILNSTPLFIIGNGDEEIGLSNALSVFKNGRMGLGTNTPSDLFHINSLVDNPLRVQVNGTTKFRVWNNGGTTIGSLSTPAPNGLYVAGAIEPAGGIRSTTDPITIESTMDSIEIVAGGSRIIVFASGGIKIITSGTGNNIIIDAGSNNLTLKGSTISLNATNILNLTATGTTNVTGGMVRFNGGTTPIAKLGSTVQVNPATGAGTVTGNGSATVLTQ